MKYDSIAKDCNFSVPKLSDYEKCKSKEELEKLSFEATEEEKGKFNDFFGS